MVGPQLYRVWACVGSHSYQWLVKFDHADQNFVEVVGHGGLVCSALGLGLCRES